VEYMECIHGMEYGYSICSGKDVRRPEAAPVEYIAKTERHSESAPSKKATPPSATRTTCR
jgi:hypothetical protein